MDIISITTLALYLLILFSIWYHWRKLYTTEIFSINRKVSWLIGAVSLFMFLNSPRDIQIISEIVKNDGISGIWLLSSQWLVAAMAPIVFAPMWKTLGLKTDNEFILTRFSGRGSILLFYFRCFYLGTVITPILVTFQLLSFSGVLFIIWELPFSSALTIACTCLFLSSIKNSIGITLRTDILHGILYAVALCIIVAYLYRTAGSIQNAVQVIEQQKEGISRIFPFSEDRKAWAALAVLFGIQWWSTGLFDGSGPEMQKYNSARTPLEAVYLAMGGLLLTVAFSILNTIITVLSLSIHSEGFFAAIKSVLPISLKMLITLGFWSAFISTAEATLNWGSSYIIENVWYRTKTSTSFKLKAFHSFIVILLLTGLSLVLSIYFNTLRSLLELLLSFSAGVAPVFFLRWFWMRINAWTQLSAMIAAAVYTVLYQTTEPLFSSFLDYDILDPYYWKLIILTIMTTATWLSVMYLTPPDDEEHVKKFRILMPDNRTAIKRMLLALCTGFLILALFTLSMMAVLN